MAVEHAHTRGVLHGDLKPANILLDEQGNAFVTDFGSARRLGPQGQCIEYGATGLSYYMSPEQASDDARMLTQRSDIYNLGVIFHELLTLNIGAAMTGRGRFRRSIRCSPAGSLRWSATSQLRHCPNSSRV